MSAASKNQPNGAPKAPERSKAIREINHPSYGFIYGFIYGLIYGLSYDFSYGFSYGFLWLSYCSLMVLLWLFYGSSMACYSLIQHQLHHDTSRCTPERLKRYVSLHQPSLSSITAASSAARFVMYSWSLPSIITRTRGSVPEGLIRTLPSPLNSSSSSRQSFAISSSSI